MTQYVSRHLSTVVTNPYITNCFTPSQAIPGTVWYDTGAQAFKVWDGSTWMDVSTSVTVELDPDSADALDWAIGRIKREKQISELADKYPMVADALKELEVVLKLHQNLENNETNK